MLILPPLSSHKAGVVGFLHANSPWKPIHVSYFCVDLRLTQRIACPLLQSRGRDGQWDAPRDGQSREDTVSTGIVPKMKVEDATSTGCIFDPGINTKLCVEVVPSTFQMVYYVDIWIIYIYYFGCSEATFGAVFEVEDLDAVELLSVKENKDERPRGGVSWWYEHVLSCPAQLSKRSAWPTGTPSWKACGAWRMDFGVTDDWCPLQNSSWLESFEIDQIKIDISLIIDHVSSSCAYCIPLKTIRSRHAYLHRLRSMPLIIHCRLNWHTLKKCPWIWSCVLRPHVKKRGKAWVWENMFFHQLTGWFFLDVVAL